MSDETTELAALVRRLAAMPSNDRDLVLDGLTVSERRRLLPLLPGTTPTPLSRALHALATAGDGFAPPLGMTSKAAAALRAVLAEREDLLPAGRARNRSGWES